LNLGHRLVLAKEFDSAPVHPPPPPVASLGPSWKGEDGVGVQLSDTWRRRGGLVWHDAQRGRSPASDSNPRAAAVTVCGRLVTAQGKQRDKEREESSRWVSLWGGVLAVRGREGKREWS
jgi:hypothetical protein